MNELYHHGILGQKWGKRNGPPYPLKSSDYSGSEKKAEAISYYRESTKPIKTNPDGSYAIPKGFKFNRVGKNTTDIRMNQTGGLYVSYGKADAARYVKIYGPDLVNRITKNTREAIQHISTTGDMRLASDDQFVSNAGKFLKDNPDIAKTIQNDGFLNLYLDSKASRLTPDNIERMISNPRDKNSKQMAWVLSAMCVIGDEHYSEITKLYDYFRKQGFDAIPDVHDTWGGTSETAMIVINPKKLK